MHLNKVNSRNRYRYDRFTHNVSHDVFDLDGQTEQVRVVIREHKDDVPSQGGSSFRVIASSGLHKQMCPVRDYLNGTYLACCSIDKAQNIDEYEINISIQFADFTAFSTNYVPNDQLISRHLIDVEHHHNTIIYQKCERIDSLNVGHGYWKKYSPSDEQYSQYILMDKYAKGGYCAVHGIQKEKLSECFEAKYNHRITMMGDSHIRFGFLRLSCLSIGIKLRYHKAHTDFVIMDHHFKWKPLCSDLVEGLDDYIKYAASYADDVTSTSPYHLVVLGVGQWDIAARSPEVY